MINNYWSFGKLYKKIENKAEENGIAINRITEEYTSRTCPIYGDDSKSNCKDRIFLCGFCGYVDHRDIIGARNIMLKGMYGLQNIHRDEVVPLGVSI
jgi:putative transposase